MYLGTTSGLIGVQFNFKAIKYEIKKVYTQGEVNFHIKYTKLLVL